jgi:hypothetical protein
VVEPTFCDVNTHSHGETASSSGLNEFMSFGYVPCRWSADRLVEVLPQPGGCLCFAPVAGGDREDRVLGVIDRWSGLPLPTVDLNKQP